MSGKLYMVATPIGNLSDITERALETLRSSDYILCEDTRNSKNLLEHFGISKSLISYHHHSDVKKMREIENLLNEGKNLALVTDAGTPGISDPGNILVSELVKRNPSVEIVPIPGASAVISALSISGFPTDKYVFLGFPPHKNKRQKFFKELAEQNFTSIFFESGHRIMKCIDELQEFLPADRKVVICRELTKKFETIYRGTVGDIKDKMKDDRGEFVVIISS